MPLVKAGQIVADSFVRVSDDEAIPPGVPVIVSAKRFLADPTGIVAHDAPVGVVWPNDRRVAELEPWLPQLALVALAFPTFRDGRAYSQARLLRERFGFRGELRATGQILRDQFLFLVRAGFDSLEVKKPEDAQAYAAVLARYSVFYQAASDGRIPAQRRRLQGASAVKAREAV
jgi:uncharacterized protein (DUF934 family)